MKQILFLLTLCTLAFSTQCERKIEQIQKEITYAKKYNHHSKASKLELVLKEIQADCAKDPYFYDKKLEAKKLKEQEIEKIEQELKELKKQKDYMSKAEYKSKKEALKERKDVIKEEIEEYINKL
ncbi:DUF1090 domain-containing lipoprotein [Campylobacter volucris]|uniref:DUF1090 domain-containing lipoprotein n=1 Tax=Campylobacter volucris TaxID=1031542 RepID=A0AAE6D0A4_9BACT|nr:DUF1090 domain-containing lipoprotein [Campylobacter volucris]AJC93751.1 hypothetical lipoprotein (DUF1090 domain) [Campylobacter volucris LMG 24379]KAB0579769.1 DUF1090 domain-containing lipoprotein [Campylobacter volucris]QBL13867.1 DUF1090 domain-containing lipoprotein [Campylobacter volucris]QEL07964.1 DUF1090 domain-containing protein [Campylobacter volucris]TXK70693.1 DUF1090 domain-containing lipoprotein [Campylobacter volucris]